jgi:hypothetical protein
MSISGTTMSGKTTWLYRLLTHASEMFETPPTKMLYCYGVWQSLFDEMQSKLNEISFHQGLPSEEDIDNLTSNNQHNIVIMDDLMHQVVENVNIESLFTRGAHHKNLTVIYLNQNLYCQGKFSRTLSLNTHILVLMKNPRDTSQIQILGKQVFPGRGQLLVEAYEDCMKDKFGYLLVDLSPQTLEKYRLRSHVFPNEDSVVYVPL